MSLYVSCDLIHGGVPVNVVVDLIGLQGSELAQGAAGVEVKHLNTVRQVGHHHVGVQDVLRVRVRPRHPLPQKPRQPTQTIPQLSVGIIRAPGNPVDELRVRGWGLATLWDDHSGSLQRSGGARLHRLHSGSRGGHLRSAELAAEVVHSEFGVMGVGVRVRKGRQDGPPKDGAVLLPAVVLKVLRAQLVALQGARLGRINGMERTSVMLPPKFAIRRVEAVVAEMDASRGLRPRGGCLSSVQVQFLSVHPDHHHPAVRLVHVVREDQHRRVGWGEEALIHLGQPLQPQPAQVGGVGVHHVVLRHSDDDLLAGAARALLVLFHVACGKADAWRGKKRLAGGVQLCELKKATANVSGVDHREGLSRGQQDNLVLPVAVQVCHHWRGKGVQLRDFIGDADPEAPANG
eukprot:RCo037445